jgi:ATP-dependent Lhr-like helicase
MAGPASAPAAAPSGAARLVAELLRRRGASFRRQIAAGSSLLPSQIDAALAELIALGMVTGDSFAGLRALLGPGRPRRRTGTRRATSPFDLQPAGRWSLLAAEEERAAPGGAPDGIPSPKSPAAEDEAAERLGRLLLRRYGIVFRRLVVRERLPIPWRDLLVALRRLELRGEIRGGRFVTGFSGEQFALPEAIEHLRRGRDSSPAPERRVSAADPLNLRGVLTPEERIPPQARRAVLLP